MNSLSSQYSNILLTGVLLLENNKTYGRTPNKKRLYYKCIPNNKDINPFLIPYEIKMEFSKKFVNKYITFIFDYWPETSKYPYGQIVETLGNVDNLESFYEYQLHSKKLHISISKLSNKTRLLLLTQSSDQYIEQIAHNSKFKIIDRQQEYIITIDPQHSLDFDDGFSITTQIDGTFKISVYIANVYFWLEILELWTHLSDRISTIYLPDKRRTMLPSILSDELCSLQEKKIRFAFTMDLIVNENGQILEIPQFCNTIIQVTKNYCYEDQQLLKDLQYNHLFDMSKKIATTIHHTDEIIDSHDLVAFWMVQMNKYCSEYMIQHQFGIFRSATIWSKEPPLIKAQPDSGENPLIKAQHEISRIIQYWNNSSGQYVLYSDNHKILEHAIMNMKSYIHITSPIRRLVDLLNQMSMMQHLGSTTLSTQASAFLLKWLQNIDYINTSTKSIRKVQTECDILTRCINEPMIIQQIFDGIILDKFVKPNGNIKYTVYLESLKIMSSFTMQPTTNTILNNAIFVGDKILEIHSIHKFKLYLFQDEHNSKKKIRLQRIIWSNL